MNEIPHENLKKQVFFWTLLFNLLGIAVLMFRPVDVAALLGSFNVFAGAVVGARAWQQASLAKRPEGPPEGESQ